MSREIGLAATALALMVTLPGAKVAMVTAAPAAELKLTSQGASLTGSDEAASVTVPLAGTPLVATQAYPPAVRAAGAGTSARKTNNAGEVSSNVAVDNVLLAAYQRAAAAVPESCGLEMSLLAAIGQVESGNLANYELDENNAVTPAVLGPVLDGTVWSEIRDTDFGVYDGDQTFDRAVGPMQFIPSTWLRFGVDLDQDGERNPQDIDDAAGAAAAYLCYGGRDLGTSEGLRAGIYSYNHSKSYVDLVLAWKAQYDEDGFGSLSSPTTVLTGGSTVTTTSIVTAAELPTFPGSSVPGVGGSGAGHPSSDPTGSDDAAPAGVASFFDWFAQVAVSETGERVRPVTTTKTKTKTKTVRPTRETKDDGDTRDDSDGTVTPPPAPDPTITPAPVVTPSPSPDPTVTPSPVVTPTPSPEPSPSPDPEPSPEPSPTPEPTLTPAPVVTPEPAELPTCDVLTDADLVALDQLADGDEPVPADGATLSEEELVAISAEDAAALAAECEGP